MIISILSLIVAALAVFFGPIIAWRTSNQQLAVSLEVANKQIIAPMRQAWINNLRDLISEIASNALHYFVSGFEDRTDQEYQHLIHLEYKIKLMLNPREEDHQQLEQLIAQMISYLQSGTRREQAAEFPACHEELIALSRDVLKREWDRVKEKIQPL